MIIELTEEEGCKLFSLLWKNSNNEKYIELHTEQDRQILWDLECLLEKQMPPEFLIDTSDIE